MPILSYLLHGRAAGAGAGDGPSPTVAQELAAQWYNPTDIAYAFLGLVNVIGDGRIMPTPDYPCKVVNLDSGYARESKSFVVSRLLRDLEASEARQLASEDRDYSLKITVFEATGNCNGPTQFSWTYLHFLGALITGIQLGIAVIPLALKGDWSVFLITAVGTLFVQWCGCLPQWTSEKLPSGQHSDSIYALTAGNGSRDIMVIIGYGLCLDLESLAAPHPPRASRPWEKFTWLSRPRRGETEEGAYAKRKRRRPGQGPPREAIVWSVWPFSGVPLGFALTRITYAALSVLWLCLLVNVAAPREFPDSWCFLAVGGLGMFQNAWLAAKELRPAMRNLPLKKVDTFLARKVMDGLMDFHTIFDRGMPLLEEFFPGPLLEAEAKWWANGDFAEYERERLESGYRGTPRRLQPERYRKFSFKPPPKRRATLAEMKVQKASRPEPPPRTPKVTTAAYQGSKRDSVMSGAWQRPFKESNLEKTREDYQLSGPSSGGSSPTKKRMSAQISTAVCL
ncbi:uncharacterized protein PG986_000142 [Apiospora aurea]|uniref:Uncharacterized protein n=1 Tax=Apiospora aurea TaxID=335848 RepID=A0ABR1QUS8_9PEZI